MNKLSEEGLSCKIKDEEMNLKVYALLASADSVARAPMQGLIQFNGEYGCNWCLHHGIWVQNPKNPKYGSHKYPLLETPVAERNMADTTEHIAAGTEKKPCFGFKNPSQLINLNKFDIIEGFDCEYMHIVSGIGKQFSNIWFGNTTTSSRFLSKDEVEKINTSMLNVKVPNQIGRLTRAIKDRHFWKTREWKNFILYYSLPILIKYMPKEYVRH